MLVRDRVANAQWTGNIIDDFQSNPTDCLDHGPTEHNLISASNCASIPPSNTIGMPTDVEAQTSPPSPLTGSNLHLAAGSVGINAGSPATLADNIDGEPRTAPPDLGAETDAAPPSPDTTCPTTMPFGNLGKGVAARDDANGPGYLM